ncbi:MAG: sugar ABC transporter ATP-binding protein [Bacillota bacterium]|nr:sugar ABC transporter ATP-binding protein [Bacillota bacterium]
MEHTLEMRHVTKRFPGVLALNDVSLHLKSGEILAICGENGAGKSTLMKVLSGMYTSSQYDGEIWFDGKKVEHMDVKTAREIGIEMVYQETNVFLDGTVMENLFVGNLPGKGKFVDYKELKEKSQALLDEVGIKVKPDSVCRPLSSGQLQLLSIARARVKKPNIIVFDEPTSALTESEVELLFGLIRKMQKEGVGIIYISHKLDEVFALADRVMVIRDGECISDRDIKETDNDKLIGEMIGRTMTDMYPHDPSPATDEVVLSVKHLTVPNPTATDLNIVEDISFDLHRGEILGLGGLIGAGRSESLGAIFGQYKEGVTKEIYLEGKKVEIKEPDDAIKLGIAFVTEERKRNGFVWLLPIYQNISLISLRRLLPHKFLIDFKAEWEQAKTMFDRLRVKAPSMNTLAGTLSGGNQQKVVLGKWLVTNPKILFIDEPTKGIDVGTKAEFYEILRELTKQGISIIMVSSDMPELVNMSDRILVLSSGKIQGELTGEHRTQKEVMELAIR